MVDARVLTKAAFYVALAVALFGAAVLPCWAAAANGNARAVLTIADGPVQVLRGATRLDAPEGFMLQDDDIVRTLSGTRAARLEFTDGRVLDLGPATQALLLSERASASQGLEGSAAVVLHGWAKLIAATEPARVATPRMVVVTVPRGATLLHAAPDGGSSFVFAESRAVQVLARSGTAELALNEGEAREREGKGQWTPTRPQGVPRALADSLPRRAARFAGLVAAEPAAIAPVVPEDLVAWRQAEPALFAPQRPAQSKAAVVASRTPAKLASNARRSTSIVRAKPPTAPERVAEALPLPEGSFMVTPELAPTPSLTVPALRIGTVSLPLPANALVPSRPTAEAAPVRAQPGVPKRF